MERLLSRLEKACLERGYKKPDVLIGFARILPNISVVKYRNSGGSIQYKLFQSCDPMLRKFAEANRGKVI